MSDSVIANEKVKLPAWNFRLNAVVVSDCTLSV